MKTDTSDTIKIETSNSLVDLRERLKVEHAAVAKTLRTSVSHAMAAGDILIGARARLNHGQWLPWLQSCGVPERTAQRYVRLARNRTIIESKSDAVSDLSISGVLAMLAAPRKDETAADLVGLAEQAADVSLTFEGLVWYQELRQQMAEQDRHRETRLAMIAEAKTALKKIEALMLEKPTIVESADAIWTTELGKQFFGAQAEFSALRASEEANVRKIDAAIGSLKNAGVDVLEIAEWLSVPWPTWFADYSRSFQSARHRQRVAALC